MHSGEINFDKSEVDNDLLTFILPVEQQQQTNTNRQNGKSAESESYDSFLGQHPELFLLSQKILDNLSVGSEFDTDSILIGSLTEKAEMLQFQFGSKELLSSIQNSDAKYKEKAKALNYFDESQEVEFLLTSKVSEDKKQDEIEIV